MNNHSDSTQADFKQWQRSLVMLSITYLVVALVVALAVSLWMSWTASLMALGCALVCWVAAGIAQFCARFPRGDLFLMTRLMTSSLVRVGIPLLGLIIVKFGFPDAFDRSMVYLIVLFYVVGLVFELKSQMTHLRATGDSAASQGQPPSGNSI